MTKNQTFNAFYYTFFGLVIVACLFLTIIFDLGWLDLVSCAAGIFYVVLLSTRNILNFLIGLVSTTTYIFIAFQTKIYGEVIFYLIFDLPMSFISFFVWKRHMEDPLRVSAKKLKVKHFIIIVAVCSASVALYALFLKWIGGVNYIVDAISTVVSTLATILMCLRYNEQWFMWIIVYVVSIILWATTFNLLMLIMSSCCFISSIVGYIDWLKNARKTKALEELKAAETKPQEG